jgi:NCS2 family nucleobase:cation symporter-2
MPLLFGDRSVVADAFAATRGVSLLIGTFSLSIMVGLTIWGRGSWRFYPALAGMTGGWLFAAWVGAVQPAVWLDIAAKPWFALPVPQALGIDFEWSLVPIFMIAAIASGVKGIGDLTVCQRANNLNWQRVDLQSASRGGMAFGVTNLLAGLFGTLGHGASSTNVGMSVATGVTSRQVAWAMGLMLGAIALMPKVASLFSHLPPPVMGAVMVYAAAFTTVAGIQILSSRLLDVRRILVVGLSVTFGLSPALLPELYVDAPSVLRPVLVSSVSLTVLVAVGLNALLRLGSAQSAIIDLRSGVDNHATIQAKFAAFGESVGARRDVVDWAAESVSHGFDALEGQAAAGMMQVSLRFTEFKLAVEMDYVGPPLVADRTRPDWDELLKSTDGVLRMAAFLVGRHAEKFEVEHLHGRTRVKLLFEH